MSVWIGLLVCVVDPGNLCAHGGIKTPSILLRIQPQLNIVDIIPQILDHLDGAALVVLVDAHVRRLGAAEADGRVAGTLSGELGVLVITIMLSQGLNFPQLRFLGVGAIH